MQYGLKVKERKGGTPLVSNAELVTDHMKFKPLNRDDLVMGVLGCVCICLKISPRLKSQREEKRH